MLVLSRKVDEKIQIGDNITITVVRVRGNVVRIGIEAPNEMRVLRGELKERETKTEQPPALMGLADEAPLSSYVLSARIPRRMLNRVG